MELLVMVSLIRILLKPQKLLHPSFIPIGNEATEDLEPGIGRTDSTPLECPSFPLLKQHMQRINTLRASFQRQQTRTKRISFLRKLLQDGGTDQQDSLDNDDEDINEKASPIPAALAMLMNATKFLSDAPGIIRRKYASRPSLPASTLQLPESQQARPRSFSMSPDVQSRRVESMKDYLFTRRRQSIAPTNN